VRHAKTTSEYELASFPKKGLQKAKELVKIRSKLGYFKSLEEAVKFGFK
jgi:DNA uptake protein ComE-like DNA-binding protein